MKTMRCSLCGTTIAPDHHPHTPFCSRRCQELDLHRWLDERYGLPWEDPNAEVESDADNAETQDSNGARP
jgi:endogenous inhibitor of DNA gyrase (YacG/DUF329 family)